MSPPTSTSEPKVRDACSKLKWKLRTRSDGAQKNSPYPIMEAQAAPSDSPQKLGRRASSAMTSSNEGSQAGVPAPVPAARSASMGGGSSAPRSGSRTVNFNTGVSRSPASPTMKNAMRQLMTLVMKPPNTMPRAAPMGMPNEYALNARARSLGGK